MMGCMAVQLGSFGMCKPHQLQCWFDTCLWMLLEVCAGVAGVYFGQLLGMCDHLSFTLGRAGYRIHKIVPYGPVQETLQYLIRHASLAFAQLGQYSYWYRHASLGCNEWAGCAAGLLVEVSFGFMCMHCIGT